MTSIYLIPYTFVYEAWFKCTLTYTDHYTDHVRILSYLRLCVLTVYALSNFVAFTIITPILFRSQHQIKKDASSGAASRGILVKKV